MGLYSIHGDADADPGGPKYTDPTDPDPDADPEPEHWYICIVLQR